MIASKIVGRRVASVSQSRVPAETSLFQKSHWEVLSINFEGGGALVFGVTETEQCPIVTAEYHPGRRSK